jgi:hypothetical protein
MLTIIFSLFSSARQAFHTRTARELGPGREVRGQWLQEFDKITSLLRGPLAKN